MGDVAPLFEIDIDTGCGPDEFPEKLIVPGAVDKDLLFFITAPPMTGPLAKYYFLLTIKGPDGGTISQTALGKVDPLGELHARGQNLNPMGGDLIITGLYGAEAVPNSINPEWIQSHADPDDTTINLHHEPVITGRCRYKTNMSGEFLMFKVDPVTTPIASVAEAQETERTQIGACTSLSAEVSFAPGGVGGKVGGGITKPGDQTRGKKTLGQTQNVTSVTALVVTRIAAPSRRRLRR